MRKELFMTMVVLASMAAGCGSTDSGGSTQGAGGTDQGAGGTGQGAGQGGTSAAGGGTSAGAGGAGQGAGGAGQGDRCVRPTVLGSCAKPMTSSQKAGCIEVFNQQQADALQGSCTGTTGTFAQAPCDRTGSLGYCVETDLAGVPGSDSFTYDADSAMVLSEQCPSALKGTWCPLP